MDYFISFLALAAFGYFVYTRVEASRKRKAERDSRPVNPPRDDLDPRDRDPRFDDRDLR